MPDRAPPSQPAPTPGPSRADRIAGCLLAGAVGDALGAPVEFMSLGEIRHRYGPGGIRDLDRAYGRVGALTDDTQMTLFTADGLLRARVALEEGGDVDARPLVHRAYLRWLVTQGDTVPADRRGAPGWLFGLEALHHRRGPGNTCLTALGSGRMGTRDDALNDRKGCGGVMRAAPAGLLGVDDPFALGCDVAAITHSHPTGFLSAGFLALMIDRILAGETLDGAVAHAIGRLISEPGHEETAAAVLRGIAMAAEARRPGGRPPSAEAVERLGGGWIAEEALAIAVYCALVHAADLETALILAANHSGDSDSTASITGNIAGALLGRAGIPGRWLEPLELRAGIEQVAADLATGYEATEAWKRRYPPE